MRCTDQTCSVPGTGKPTPPVGVQCRECARGLHARSDRCILKELYAGFILASSLRWPFPRGFFAISHSRSFGRLPVSPVEVDVYLVPLTPVIAPNLMKRLSFAALFVALFFLAMPAQDAQAQVKLGPRLVLAVGDISDLGGDFGIGADVRFTAGDLPVEFNGAFDYYFADDRTFPTGVGTADVGLNIFTIDFNALYKFGIDNEAFTPYAGGGLGITRLSYDDIDNVTVDGTTEVNLNIIGGAEFPLDAVTPFVQGQIGIGGDIDRFNIAGGVLFNL